MQVRSSSGWTNAGSSVNGTSRRFRYVASSNGQTTFSGADANGNTLVYDAGFIDVFLNGAFLDSTEYTATSGTSVVLVNGAAISDELNIVAYGTFQVANLNGADLQAGTVTYAKIQNVTAGKVLGRDTSGSGVVQELPIAVDSSGNTGFGTVTMNNKVNITTGADDGLRLTSTSASVALVMAGMTENRIQGLTNVPTTIYANNSEGARLDASLNFKFNSGYGSVATAYGCRSWVNFNGTGTVAIRASGNVSSISDNGVGDYTVLFATAMPDANYGVSAITQRNTTADSNLQVSLYQGTSVIQTTGGYRLAVRQASTAALEDPLVVCAAITR